MDLEVNITVPYRGDNHKERILNVLETFDIEVERMQITRIDGKEVFVVATYGTKDHYDVAIPLLLSQ